MKKPKRSTVIIILLAIAAGFLLGRRGHMDAHDSHWATTAHNAGPVSPGTIANQFWTCSMHPQIRQPKPGKCPICAMDLIPVETGGGSDVGPRELQLSAAARKLAEIQVAPVERRAVKNEIRMVGKVDYDETRLANITAWVPGRLDRLYVDYTGVPVKKGAHLVSIYSPDILTAQEELLQAIKTVGELASSNIDIVRRTATSTVESAREKLRLWGLTGEQIQTIETSGKTSDHITVYAPIGGIVIQKDAVEGAYVQTGTRIYTIADLTRVWVQLDAYESDLAWLRYGQDVEFSTEAYPGAAFHGRVAFINPVLNDKTRTVRVRVNVPNDDGKLKPNMFIRAVVRASIAGGGRVIDAALAGKWISPMHPEIVKDEPGMCDVCGMPLVKAESLGFVAPDVGTTTAAPLVIPVSAPLITGTRAVVYVQAPDDPGQFEGRVVTLGPRAGNVYLVADGLREGELVVVNGNFKIDSALQIQAQPSMMSHEEGNETHLAGNEERRSEDVAPAEVFPVPDQFAAQLEAFTTAYIAIQQYLSQDDFANSHRATNDFVASLGLMDMGLLTGEAHVAWMKLAREAETSAGMMAGAANIEQLRQGFAALSETVASVLSNFGRGLPVGMIQMQCPMAFDGRGARWLQDDDQVRNPYFGSTMLRCGEPVAIMQRQPEGRPRAARGTKGK